MRIAAMPIEAPPLKIEEIEGFAFEDDDEVLAEEKLEDEVLAELDLQAQPQELAPPPPPSPPAAKQPAPNWIIYSFIYEVNFPRFQKIASIFLATGPQYPRGGGPEGSSLVQFWWPEGRDGFHGVPGPWHGRWSVNLHGPGELMIQFNGKHGPTRPLHGVLLHGNGIEFKGLDYQARPIGAKLYSVQCLVGDGELHARAA